MRRASWARKVEPQMSPEMTLEERKEEADRCKINLVIRRMAVLFHAVEGITTKGEAGGGLVSCVTETTASGDQSKLIIRGQKPAADWVKALPVLNLNATADLDLARLALPEMTKPTIPKAERPHAETHQIIGPSGQRGLKRNSKRVEAIREFVQLQMIRHRKGLIITYKDIEDQFQGIPNVVTMHHGDLAGSDLHRDIDVLFVIGGPFAGYEDAASIAAGRGAGAVPIIKPVPVTRIATLTDGTAVAVPNVMAYADPGVDAAHNSIYRAGIIQAVGRQGQFQRSLSDTCATWIMANVIMDRPMDTIRPWAAVRPGRLHKMILAGAVITNAAHMHIVHPDIYASERAAEADRWRHHGTVEGMIAAAKPTYAQGERPSSLVTYQPGGQGQRISHAVCWEGDEATLRDKLEAALGAMKGWRVTRFTPGQEVTRKALLQSLTRPVSATSPDDGGDVPVWQAEAGVAGSEPVEHPPDG